MANRSTAMRGFTCAVAHVAVDPHQRPAAGSTASIASGLDDNGVDVRYAITIRHADGTALVAYLSEDLLGRHADRLALLVAIGSPDTGEAPAGAVVH